MLYKWKKLTIILLASVFALSLTACDKKDTDAGQGSAEQESAADPETESAPVEETQAVETTPSVTWAEDCFYGLDNNDNHTAFFTSESDNTFALIGVTPDGTATSFIGPGEWEKEHGYLHIEDSTSGEIFDGYLVVSVDQNSEPVLDDAGNEVLLLSVDGVTVGVYLNQAKTADVMDILSQAGFSFS